MKNPTARSAAKHRGYATMAVVASVSLVLLSMLGYNYLGSIRNFESQARAQVKQDYGQRSQKKSISILEKKGRQLRVLSRYR